MVRLFFVSKNKKGGSKDGGVFLRAGNVRKALAYLAKRFAVKATVQQDGLLRWFVKEMGAHGKAS
jgi:hypothetical protein